MSSIIILCYWACIENFAFSSPTLLAIRTKKAARRLRPIERHWTWPQILQVNDSHCPFERQTRPSSFRKHARPKNHSFDQPMVQELCQFSSTPKCCLSLSCLANGLLDIRCAAFWKTPKRHSFDSVISCRLTGVAFNVQAQTDKPNQTAQCLGTSSHYLTKIMVMFYITTPNAMSAAGGQHPTTPPHATCHSFIWQGLLCILGQPTARAGAWFATR